jgi:hypothetical protein
MMPTQAEEPEQLLLREFKISRVRKHISKLRQFGHNRFMASQGHQKTIDYILEQMRAMGLQESNITVQTLTVRVPACQDFSLSVGGERFNCKPFQYSPSTGAGALAGELRLVERFGCYKVSSLHLSPFAASLIPSKPDAIPSLKLTQLA